MEPRKSESSSSSMQPIYSNSDQYNEKIIREDSLAEAMLDVISGNDHIKGILASVTRLVNEKIYDPIKKALLAANFDIDILHRHKARHNNHKYSDALEFLIKEHTNEGCQKTGIFRNLTPSDIRHSPQLLAELLNTLSNNLLLCVDIKNFSDIEKCIKSLTDACFCYVEYFPHTSKNYQDVKSIIMPSEAEGLARIKYLEINQTEKLTLKSGIRKDNKSLVDKNDAPPHAYASGKSTFATVSLKLWLELVVNKYDQLKITKAQLTIKEKSGELDEMDLSQLNLVKENIRTLGITLDKYRIPKEGNRQSIKEYISLSFIERIAQSSELPLIATSSGTEGRALTTLYDLGAFGHDTQFNPSKALLITNCIFAVLQYGGHHSYIELVEPYNRLLDAVGLECLNKYEPRDLKHFQIRVIEDGWKEVVFRFIYPDIKDQVIENMDQRIYQKTESARTNTQDSEHNKEFKKVARPIELRGDHISRHRSKSVNSYFKSEIEPHSLAQIFNPPPILYLRNYRQPSLASTETSENNNEQLKIPKTPKFKS